MSQTYCRRCGFHPLAGPACPQCGLAVAPEDPTATLPSLAAVTPTAETPAAATLFFHPAADAHAADGADAATRSGHWHPAPSLFDAAGAPPPPGGAEVPRPVMRPLSPQSGLPLEPGLSVYGLPALPAVVAATAPTGTASPPSAAGEATGHEATGHAATVLGLPTLGADAAPARTEASPAAPTLLGPLPGEGAPWELGLRGADALMPPDEEEERAAEASRTPRASGLATPGATGLNTVGAGYPAAGSAPPDAPGSDGTDALGALAGPAAPLTPAPQPRLAGPGMSGPVAPHELPALELAIERPVPTTGPNTTSGLGGVGDTCPHCGTRVYETMVRCPGCYESYVSPGQRSSPRLERPRVRGARGPKLTVAVLVTLLVLAGAAFGVYHLTRPSGGAATPDAAVLGLFHALFDGQPKPGLRFVHEDHRRAAEGALGQLQRGGLSGDRLAAAVARTEGVGRIDLVVEKTVLSGGESGKVEVLFRRDGLPMRRAALPVRREGERWFVAANPFAAAP